MSPLKKSKSARPASCACGDNCHEEHSHLPGLLIAGLGLIALPLNFGLISGLEWARAWPLLLVVIGVIMAVKVTICRSRSKG